MKKNLRIFFLKELKSLDANTSSNLSKKIHHQLCKSSLFRNSKKIGIYFSKDNEPETKSIISKFIKTKKIYLPKIHEKELEFKLIQNLNQLETGAFNIQEPKESCPSISAKSLDLIVLPCIAIDKKGNRIGRGGGYFDRLLLNNPKVPTICLAYESQIINNINPEKHDQKIDFIISEKQIIKSKNYQLSKIIDGKKTAEKIIRHLKLKIKKENVHATLAVILVGNNPASEIYVKKKSEKCIEVGIDFELIRFDETTCNQKIKNKIQELNNNKEITGILVQLPLPSAINTAEIINTVSPIKDVDGLTDTSNANLTKGDETFACCTPKGILKLLEENKINIKNKKVAVVGYGKLVGKPLVTMLQNRNINFTLCTKTANNLQKEIPYADIIISATGVPHLIKKNLIKKNAIVVDAGTAKLNGRIVGDADFEGIINKVSKITPVPGGVGPMTIAMLIENIKKAYEKQNAK